MSPIKLSISEEEFEVREHIKMQLSLYNPTTHTHVPIHLSISQINDKTKVLIVDSLNATELIMRGESVSINLANKKEIKLSDEESIDPWCDGEDQEPNEEDDGDAETSAKTTANAINVSYTPASSRTPASSIASEPMDASWLSSMCKSLYPYNAKLKGDGGLTVKLKSDGKVISRNVYIKMVKGKSNEAYNMVIMAKNKPAR